MASPLKAPAATAAPRPRRSFIVRLWLEERESDAPGVWRGSVTDTASGQMLLFDNMAALADFMARNSGLPLSA